MSDDVYSRFTRAEHLSWAKERAFEFLKQGKVLDAFNSICSDLQKHPKTRNHTGLELGLRLYMIGQLSTDEQMRDFIGGIN